MAEDTSPTWDRGELGRAFALLGLTCRTTRSPGVGPASAWRQGGRGQFSKKFRVIRRELPRVLEAPLGGDLPDGCPERIGRFELGTYPVQPEMLQISHRGHISISSSNE